MAEYVQLLLVAVGLCAFVCCWRVLLCAAVCGCVLQLMRVVVNAWAWLKCGGNVLVLRECA